MRRCLDGRKNKLDKDGLWDEVRRRDRIDKEDGEANGEAARGHPPPLDPVVVVVVMVVVAEVVEKAMAGGGNKGSETGRYGSRRKMRKGRRFRGRSV